MTNPAGFGQGPGRGVGRLVMVMVILLNVCAVAKAASNDENVTCDGQNRFSSNVWAAGEDHDSFISSSFVEASTRRSVCFASLCVRARVCVCVCVGRGLCWFPFSTSRTPL